MLATAMACTKIAGDAGDEWTKMGINSLEGVFVRASPATIHANFLRAVRLPPAACHLPPAVRCYSIQLIAMLSRVLHGISGKCNPLLHHVAPTQ